MSIYQPSPGSVASRTIAYLASKPAGFFATNAELSRALGAPAGSFAGNLNQAVNAGLVHKRLEGRETVWCAGPRDGPSPPKYQGAAQDQESPSTSGPAPADELGTADLALVEQFKAVWPEPAADQPGQPVFACALFNDGRLYLEIGEEAMTLQVDQTRTLMRYLERIAMPEAS